MTTGAARAAVSIVCVFNDADVRAACLDASVERHADEAPRTELIPVDNTQNRFATAGAALNWGARRAQNPVVAFVHQDVYLHSLTALEKVAGTLLADDSLGVVGAVGVDRAGRVVGRVRDRVVLLGEPSPGPTTVDSLDEVLFLARREDLAAEPLADDPELGWHAYAVEYGLRWRALGRRVAAIDVPATHNSLTVNLARLDVAHARVAALHPGLAPVQTTCGVVSTSSPRSSARERRLRSARTFARDSLDARRAARRTGSPAAALADIRRDVDTVMQLNDLDRLVVVNVVSAPGDAAYGETIELPRSTRAVRMSAASVAEAARLIADLGRDEACLVTNLGAVAAGLRAALAGAPHVLGTHHGIGTWVLAGAPVVRLPSEWSTGRHRPWGVARAVAARAV